MAGKITALIIAIGDGLATNGVTEDELNRARQPAHAAFRYGSYHRR